VTSVQRCIESASKSSVKAQLRAERAAASSGPPRLAIGSQANNLIKNPLRKFRYALACARSFSVVSPGLVRTLRAPCPPPPPSPPIQHDAGHCCLCSQPRRGDHYQRHCAKAAVCGIVASLSPPFLSLSLFLPHPNPNPNQTHSFHPTLSISFRSPRVCRYKNDGGQPRVTGVKMTDGTELYADTVLSNATPYHTFLELMPGEFGTNATAYALIAGLLCRLLLFSPFPRLTYSCACV
jgi:hypothetical protein